MKPANLAIVVLLLFSVSTSAQQRMIPTVTLHYSGCINGLAIFLMKNQSNKSIFASVHPVPYWSEWDKTKSQYGTFRAEYKTSDAEAFTDVSDRFHEVPIFQTIPPHTTIRYGIPLRNGMGIYKISLPYIDNRRIRKLFNRVGNLSDEELNQISWREVISKETFIPCKKLL